MKSLGGLIFCFVFFSVVFFSCCKENEQVYDSFLIKVDSIGIQEKITAGEPFVIQFFGTIGNNGCYRFSKFKTEKQDSNIVVEAWEELETNAGICPAVMVYIDGEALSYQIKNPGNYVLRIKQPNGSFLEQQILVEEQSSE